ncbi:major capsid protein P2 [Vibrio hyugaensis]|uniref:major capsid protein P2 n=1 Tax=Vibrio hyugaensis TaxID=1534743 RepID=UPI0005EE79E5|nr:major capsid protein P2 [Vibrio hyugaensis]
MLRKYLGVRPKKIQAFTGVGYNGRAVVKVPTGETYDFFMLRTNLKPESLNIKCRLNGKDFYDAPATLFNSIDAYKNVLDYSGLVPDGESIIIIPFADLSMKLKDGQQQTSLVTMAGEELILEVDIAAKGTGDPATPTLSVHPVANTPQAVRIFLPRIEKHTIPAPAAGENQFSSIPSVMGRNIRRIHFKTDAITELEIKRDGDEAYATDTVLERYRAARNGRVWQDGFFHLDFLMRGYIRNELFPTERQQELLFSLHTSKVVNSIESFIEYLDIERQDLLVQAVAQNSK